MAFWGLLWNSWATLVGLGGGGGGVSGSGRVFCLGDGVAPPFFFLEGGGVWEYGLSVGLGDEPEPLEVVCCCSSPAEGVTVSHGINC